MGAGFDPSGYFLGGQNFFRRANQEIFGFSIFMIFIFATLWIKSMGTAAAADSIDILSFLFLDILIRITFFAKHC